MKKIDRENSLTSEYIDKTVVVVLNSGMKKKGSVVDISNGFITLKYFSKHVESINLMNVKNFFVVDSPEVANEIENL